MSPKTIPPDAEHPALAPEDARLVARVRDAWGPEPLTSARRAAFDAGLQERLDRARRPHGLWPALGAGLVAASLATLLLVRAQTAAPPAAPVVAETHTALEQRTAWAADLLYSNGEEADERDDDDEGLPAEYAAIAGVFLDR